MKLVLATDASKRDMAEVVREQERRRIQVVIVFPAPLSHGVLVHVPGNTVSKRFVLPAEMADAAGHIGDTEAVQTLRGYLWGRAIRAE